MVVQDPLVWYAHGPSRQRIGETKGSNRADAVPRQVKPGSRHRESCRPIDDLGADPTRKQRPPNREAGDARTNDQYLWVMHVTTTPAGTT